jgi:hypothetical protein
MATLYIDANACAEQGIYRVAERLAHNGAALDGR